MSAPKKAASEWTEARIRAFGARMPGVAAVEAVYGFGPTKAYELLASGNVDFPLISRSGRYIVPTIAVLRLLQLERTDQAA